MMVGYVAVGAIHSLAQAAGLPVKVIARVCRIPAPMSVAVFPAGRITCTGGRAAMVVVSCRADRRGRSPGIDVSAEVAVGLGW